MERTSWVPDEYTDFCDLCGASVGEAEASELGCASCRRRRLPWSRLVRLKEYASPLDAWIREIKFERSFRLARDLGALLGSRMEPVLDGVCGRDDLVVVPAPMSRRRRLARGTDHALEIATGVGRHLRAPVVRALARRHGPSQRSVPASRRDANVAGRFMVRRRRVAGRWVLLIDDVTTSGATLRGCARVLLGAGAGGAPAGVIVGVLAVTPPADRR